MSKKTHNRYKQIKKEFPNILQMNTGIIGTACKALGINRQSYYRWRKEDPKFAADCDEVLELCCDYVESQLMKNIEKGHQAAIQYWLDRKARHRGYGPVVTHVQEESATNNEISNEDLELLEAWARRKMQREVYGS